MFKGVDSGVGELAMPLLPSSLEEETTTRTALSQELGQPTKPQHSSHHVPPPQQRQPRIIDREGRFAQSRGRWNVVNTNRGVRHRRAARAPGDSFVSAFGECYLFLVFFHASCSVFVEGLISVLMWRAFRNFMKFRSSLTFCRAKWLQI